MMPIKVIIEVMCFLFSRTPFYKFTINQVLETFVSEIQLSFQSETTQHAIDDSNIAPGSSCYTASGIEL